MVGLSPLLDAVGALGFAGAAAVAWLNYRERTAESSFWLTFAFASILGTVWTVSLAFEKAGVYATTFDLVTGALMTATVAVFAVGGTATLAVIEDMRERDAELRRTKRRLDMALSGTNAGVWEWNLDTDAVAWTESFERLVGLEPGGFEGTFDAFARRVHEDDADDLEAAIDDALEHGTLFQTEYRLEHEDGHYVWVEARGHAITEDGTERMVGIVTDVTDRKETERQFRRLTERLPEAFYTLDADWQVTTWNETAAERTGIAAEEIIGEYIWDVFDERRGTELAATFREAMETGESAACEYYYDDQDRWVSIQAYPHEGGIAVISTDITGRKTQLSAVLEHAPLVLFKLDSEGTVLESQGQALEKLDLEPGEIVGESIFDLYAGNPAAIAGVERALDGEAFRMTVELGELALETQYRPITDETGAVEEVIGISLDVTDQRERERRLEENDAILKQLTETTDDVFWLFDADFSELQFVNTAYEDVWGREIDDLREDSMDFMKGVHPDDHDIVQGAIERLTNGQSTDEEYRVNPGEDFGRWVRVKGEPIFDDDGNLVRAAGIARDVTERKERERQLEALGASTEELSYAKTPEEVAEYVVEIADEVLGQSVTVVWEYDAEASRLVPWRASESARTLAEESETGELDAIPPGTDEMAAFHEDDPTFVTEYGSLENPSHPEAPLGSLLMFPMGEYAMLHVGARDIDAFDPAEKNLLSILASHAEAAFERAEREQALETYKNKLEESNENLQEFAYIASHDLHEPLRSVTSFIDLLESEYRDALDDEGQFYLDRVRNNAARMSDMIDALLEYSRVKTQGAEFDEVDAGAVLADTLDSLSVLVTETDAEISTTDLPTVVADGNQLGQVFQNLLKNAIEHGGDPPEIEVSARDAGDAWEFAVADNGAGIPEQHHDRIFEIFQQATTDDDSGEAGIGLAICERIVSRHHGEIWVESDDTGSTFKFTIPKRQVA